MGKYSDDEIRNCKKITCKIACRIRAYVKGIVACCDQDGLDDETAAWFDWATKKADWFDPTVARDDEFFGKREHERSSSEKALMPIGCHWGRFVRHAGAHHIVGGNPTEKDLANHS